MPAEPNPLDQEDLFDSVVLAGVKSPGVVTLSGHDSKVDWDIKAGSGQKGASMTKKAQLPIAFQASFYLADREDFAAWPAFRDLINSTTSGATPKALDIYHPDLAVQGITSVVKGVVGGVKHDGKGGQTIVVTFQQYAPPVKSGGSPNGSSSKPKTPANDPDAAAKAQLAALTAEYQKTPWGTL